MNCESAEPMSRWILIVDDDEAFRDCVSEIFSAEGFTVKTAAGGQEALGILSLTSPETAPSLMFLDARMPDMNGNEMLQRLHKEMPKHAASLPILLCSASPNTFSKNLLSERTAFLKKPVGLTEIVESAQQLLRRVSELEHRPAS